MIVVPQSFREMPRWWHDAAGRGWLDTLPDRVEEQCRRWTLALDGAVMHGSNALVVPVRRDREALVLRLEPPGDDTEQHAAALRLWDGRGTVRLDAVDEDAGAMLLERVDGRRTLLDEPLPRAVTVLAELVRTLAVPVPATVKGTDEIAREHAETFEREWSCLDGPCPREQLDAAIACAVARSVDEPAPTAVDGDLHFEQVLAATRAPWLVVDPVLLRGDREYDLGRILWSRLDEAATDAEVRDLFGLFVGIAGVPAGRAREWVVVRSMSYLLWGLRHGLTEDPPRCRRLLEIFA
ncbi:MAG TPA: aminoglycoside phosphotransferase family protein [Microbacterium sp.]|nr:aminoglycoside phosphotransferase family protein [Microbacterium sp.]